MLNLINISTLAISLYTSFNTADIIIKVDETNLSITTNLKKEKDIPFAYQLLLMNEKEVVHEPSATDYNFTYPKTAINETVNHLALGFNSTQNNFDISKYKNLNEYTKIMNSSIAYYNSTYTEMKSTTIYINLSEKEITPMEELLTALTTAVQSAVSIFVEGFGGLTQIFYNGTEITFIGGILVVGLAVMFLMMFLRWIISFVKGI